MRVAWLALLGLGLVAAPATAQQVWSGTTFYFEKPDSANWGDPAYQDRITDDVWITRANRMGIFNIAQEGSFTHDVSPVDTEWATGSATEWETLVFQNWEDWAGSGGIPPATVGVDAVVHLIGDDIYLDIRFESWTSGALGGGFAYWRAADPTPVEETSWGRIKARTR